MRDVHIIAFRRMNQLELSGNVITTPDILSTLKVGYVNLTDGV